MITALDRVRIQILDPASAAEATERLLARAGLLSEETATFCLDNVTLELSLSDGTEGLAGLSFAVADAQAAARACERRALNPQPPVAFAESDATGVQREGHSV